MVHNNHRIAVTETATDNDGGPTTYSSLPPLSHLCGRHPLATPHPPPTICPSHRSDTTTNNGPPHPWYVPTSTSHRTGHNNNNNSNYMLSKQFPPPPPQHSQLPPIPPPPSQHRPDNIGAIEQRLSSAIVDNLYQPLLPPFICSSHVLYTFLMICYFILLKKSSDYKIIEWMRNSSTYRYLAWVPGILEGIPGSMQVLAIWWLGSTSWHTHRYSHRSTHRYSQVCVTHAQPYHQSEVGTNILNKSINLEKIQSMPWVPSLAVEYHCYLDWFLSSSIDIFVQLLIHIFGSLISIFFWLSIWLR